MGLVRELGGIFRDTKNKPTVFRTRISTDCVTVCINEIDILELLETFSALGGFYVDALSIFRMHPWRFSRSGWSVLSGPLCAYIRGGVWCPSLG